MLTLLAALSVAGTPGEAENLSEDQGVHRFTLPTDSWKVWMAELAAAGWTRRDGEGHTASLVRGDRRGLATLSAPVAEGSPWMGMWAEAALVEPPELTGDCVAVPDVTLDVTLPLVVDRRPDRDRVEQLRRLQTHRSVDVDGDGWLDALVPSVEPDQCPHEARWTVYLTRERDGRRCGIATGEIQGYWLRSPSFTAANRLVLGASRVKAKKVPGPGMEQRGDQTEWTWTHTFDGTTWTTEVDERTAECVHCTVLSRCTQR